MGRKKIVEKEEQIRLMPVVVLQQVVLTPYIPQPVKIEDEQQREYLEKCYNTHSTVFFATSKSQEATNEENLYPVGEVCIIDKVLNMPGAPSLVFVRPVERAKIINMVYSPSYPMVKIELLPHLSAPKKKNPENLFLLERIDSLYQNLMQFLGEPEKSTSEKIVEENSLDPISRLYSIVQVSPLSWEEKYKVSECNTYSKLLETIVSLLDESLQRIQLQATIHERTHHELSRQQKEAFLRQHMRQIQQELGDSEDSDDINSLAKLAEGKNWTNEAKEHFNKELRKLGKLNLNNPEYSVQYDYLENFLKLPWNNYSHKKFTLDKVEKILNRDHFGLDKVKERILEYMAVFKLRNDLKAPILCLYGPPGVGKTSIGKSIAEALGKEYERISLGGMHDEAEIRGHRRTYIGAMPGRILKSLSKLKYGNPLILLDEIDKVGKDFKGDPSSALLEALDPEQNHTFHDNFIDYPYDLSKVLFIATANELGSIPPALRDRLEIIEMKGYTQEEKREIALRHLVKKVLEDNGLKQDEVCFLPEAINTLIINYTKEKGVRQLEKALSRIARKLAYKKVKDGVFEPTVTPELVFEYLGKKDNYLNGLGFH